ncbi:5-formyltetrahydrofolate cyclo-ligase [Paenibacillus tarimensis]
MTEHLHSDAKRMLREQAAKLRNGLPGDRRTLWSQQICGKAAGLFGASPSKSFMVYVSYRTEVDTGPLIEWGWRQGVDVIVPKVEPDSRTMKLYRLTKWSELIPGAFGIPEPNPQEAEAWADHVIPGAVIVPGLSFDTAGGRLGYGGGYYDRFYDRLRGMTEGGQPMPLWIGLSFEAQMVERVPCEPHDVRMDIIVTERAVYEPLVHTKEVEASDYDGTDAF